MNSNIYKLLEEFSHQNNPSQHSLNPQTYFPQKMIQNVTTQKTEELRGKQFIISYKLSSRQINTREKLVATIIESGRRFLGLKNKTIQLIIRFFDLYCMKMSEGYLMNDNVILKGDRGLNPLERKEQAQLIMTACAFSCSKYNEIYPPSINDFIYVFNDKFSRNDVIKKEVQIIQLNEFAYTISTVSGWYQYYFQEILPSWGIDCLIKCYNISMEDLAKSIKSSLAAQQGTTHENEVVQRVVMIQKTLRNLPLLKGQKSCVYQA